MYEEYEVEKHYQYQSLFTSSGMVSIVSKNVANLGSCNVRDQAIAWANQ